MSKSTDEFELESQQKRIGLAREFVDFLVNNKKWWLTPILVVLFVLSLSILLTNTAIGPFIYVLF